MGEPNFGAAGLGWEVQCNGMEISQFTYFQQIGGFECKPVSLELTYGLERLAMFVQMLMMFMKLFGITMEQNMEKFLKKMKKNNLTIIFCMLMKKIYINLLKA